jgi:phosphoserine aminotransferase
MSRAHNFSAGPAVLPLEVLSELAEALPNFQNTGLGLMELSHRSSTFDAVIQSAKSRLRFLLDIPEDYEVLFLQGGASMQFYMTALNFLLPTDTADYIDSGTWSTKAIKEAKRVAPVQTIWRPENGVFNSVPTQNDIQENNDSVYLHYTSNNTIYGTQFYYVPDTNKALIADLSSDICSRPIDVSKHQVLYAGAQKNLGPSGVTAVILSPWAVQRSREVNSLRKEGLPSMLNYGLMVDKDSMFNTPNTFGIFALERVLAWVERQGGLEAVSLQNQRKAELLYSELDSSSFWKPHADRGSRSQMNVTWKLADPALESVFLAEADAQMLKGLKGHRSVGGVRASIYNACPLESVETLVSFMKSFHQNH